MGLGKHEPHTAGDRNGSSPQIRVATNRCNRISLGDRIGLPQEPVADRRWKSRRTWGEGLDGVARPVGRPVAIEIQQRCCLGVVLPALEEELQQGFLGVGQGHLASRLACARNEPL